MAYARKNRQYGCDICPFKAYNFLELEKHRAVRHVCSKCERFVKEIDDHNCNATFPRGRPVAKLKEFDDWSLIRAHRGVLQTFRLDVSETGVSIENFFKSYYSKLEKILAYIIKSQQCSKIHLKLRVTLTKPLKDVAAVEEEETATKYLYGITHILLNLEEIDEVVFSSANNIIDNLNIFQENGSGWSLLSIDQIVLDVAKFRPFRGRGNVVVPEVLKKRQGLINPPSDLNNCFQYCVAATYLKLTDRAIAETKKTYDDFFISPNGLTLSCLNSEGTTIKDIYNFERKNPNWSVNVYGYMPPQEIDEDRLDEEDMMFDLYEEQHLPKSLSSKVRKKRGRTSRDNDIENEDAIWNSEKNRPEIYPVKIAKQMKEFHMNLLLVSTENEKYYHYMLITNFSRFMGKTNNRAYFWCNYCMGKFSRESVRDEHQIRCEKFGVQSLKFPSRKSVDLKRARYSMDSLYFFCADFECVISPISPHLNHENDSFTVREGIHQICSYAWALIGPNGVVEYNKYRGLDSGSKFVKEILRKANEYIPYLNASKELRIKTPEDMEVYRNSEVCGLCSEPIATFEYDGCQMKDMVFHHDHAALGTSKKAGRLICAAHDDCNLQAKRRPIIPCIFHNSKKYDSKLILQSLKKASVTEVSCIAKNSENIMSMTLDKKVRIIDSFAHLPASLSELVSNLKLDGFENFESTLRVFSQYEPFIDTLISKQFFPYEHITFANLDEKSDVLPPQHTFFSSLTVAGISTADYTIAQSMYTLFDCKCMGDYLLIYNLLDVLLLADVWQHYRKSTFATYGIEVNNFISSPSLSFAAGIISSSAHLEYISDPQVYLLVRESLRGGMVFLNKRFSKSNVPGTYDYNDAKPNCYIKSYDVNSLYSFALKQKLPYDNIQLLPDDELLTFDPLKIADSSEWGYLVCCDLNIPQSLHDFFSDMPPCPEKIIVKTEYISEYQKGLVSLYKNYIANPFDKEFLTLNLFDKQKYTCYHKILQFYCHLGVKLGRVHQVVKFRIAKTFEAYVNSNIELRKQATSPAMKNIFKLILNSFYGSLAMRKELHKSVHIALDEATAIRYTSKPYFECFSVVNCETSVITCKKPVIELDRFPLVASVILDISKLHMYSLFYDGFRKQVRGNVKLLYVDTDCFNIEFTTNGIDSQLLAIKVDDEGIFDFSNMPIGSLLYDESKKGVPGLLKSEIGGKVARAFVGLKRKMYSFKFYEGKDKMRGKGIPRRTLNQHTFYTYLRTLRTKKIMRVDYRSIRSMQNQLYTILQRKIGFNALSTDRFILRNGVDTLPYGHFSIRNRVSTLCED